jgi:hypothetical protein
MPECSYGMQASDCFNVSFRQLLTYQRARSQQLCASSRLMHRSNRSLLDHRVGVAEQRDRKYRWQGGALHPVPAGSRDEVKLRSGDVFGAAPQSCR